MNTQQRFIEMAQGLPTDAPDPVLLEAIAGWNPDMADSTREKTMSWLRLLTDARVRRRWRAIWRAAEADPTPRLAAKFLVLARRVRDGEKL
jgi:hypothetical protein